LQPKQAKSRSKQFQCPQCHKKFQQKGNLRNHMRTHSGEQPFGCEVCNKK
jgi:uncharacterized Zn-finger protein